MKKIISYILLLVMCVSLFAGCANNNNQITEPTEPTEASLTSAKELLFAMYKDSNGTKTVADYKLVSVIAIEGKTFNVSWALDVTAGDAEAVALEEGDKTVTVKILNNRPAEEVAYSVVGTIADGDKTETVTFTHTIPAVEVKPEAQAPVIVDAPVADTAYKFVIFQNSAEVMKTLYFTGEMSGYYLATTEDVAQSKDVYIENVDGGFKMYFMNGDKKTYIDVTPREGGKANVGLNEEDGAVYTFDATAKTMFTVVEGTTFYLGTYGTYVTFSASNISYISGDNASKVDVSQFPGRLCTMGASSSNGPAIVEAPAAETAYKFAIFQNNAEVMKTLYFTGAMDGKYLQASDDVSKAVDVYLEAVDGGFKIYFKNGDAKKYLDVYPRETNKASVQIADETNSVFTYDAAAKTFFTVLGENTFYLGTYSTYQTFSASSTYYITGDNAAKVDIEQFPGRFVTVG